MNAADKREGFFAHPERQLLLADYLARHVPGDRQVLSDEQIDAVLAGRERLSRRQWSALLASPLTLCRLRFLEGRRLAAQADAADTTDATPGRDAWQRSTAELLAASDTETDCSLVSADGLWALHALTTRGVTRLLLQLRAGPEAAAPDASRPEPGTEVAVLDGAGGTLLMGPLDDDNELEGRWARALDLRSHLARHGGTWSVVRS